MRDAAVDLLPPGAEERLVLEVFFEEKNSFVGDDFRNCGLEILAKLEVEDGDFIAELQEFHKKILSVQKIVVLLQHQNLVRKVVYANIHPYEVLIFIGGVEVAA